MSIAYVDPDPTNRAQKVLLCALIDNGNGQFIVEPITGTKGSDNLVTIGGSGGGGGGTLGSNATPNVSTLKDASTNNTAAVDTSGRLSVAINAPLVSTSSSLTSQTASATTKQLLPANSARKGSYFKNDSTTSTMYIAFAATASTGAYTEAIPPTGSFANTSGVISQVAISAIWTDPSGTVVGNCRITEFL